MGSGGRGAPMTEAEIVRAVRARMEAITNGEEGPGVDMVPPSRPATPDEVKQAQDELVLFNSGKWPSEQGASVEAEDDDR